LAGQRWIVQNLDEQTKTLVVAPHPSGVVPRFEPSGGEPAHDRLIAEMRAVYLAVDVPSYLDDKAQELLAEGRETFRQLQLERRSLVAENRDDPAQHLGIRAVLDDEIFAVDETVWAGWEGRAGQRHGERGCSHGLLFHRGGSKWVDGDWGRASRVASAARFA
jgi:hypothetical protein